MRVLLLVLAACAGADAFAPASRLHITSSFQSTASVCRARISTSVPARTSAVLGLRAQVKQGGDVPDLSPEEKEKSKKLADAWIKMDKAKEAKEALKGSSVYLLGLPGLDLKGIGMMLAKRLEIYRFLDITEVLAPVAQQPDLSHSVKELKAKIGEEDYRAYESAILAEVQSMLRCVVSTDSGVALDNVNWGKLREGIVVYLRTDNAKLAEAQDEYSLSEIDAELERCGEKLMEADIVMGVEPKANLDETAMRICEGIKELIEKNPPKRTVWQEEHDKREAERAEREAEIAARKAKGFAPKPKED